MAPKQKFSKEDIVNSAFDIAKEGGFDSITIRKIAQELGSSIAPIYVNFNDVHELKEEVVKKTINVSRQILKQQNSGNLFRDIGMASLTFAKDYSVLYRDLIMKKNSYMKYESSDINVVIEQMKKDQELTGFSDEELRMILLKMQIFQTGLSVMSANGLLPGDLKDEMIPELLDRIAEDVITAARVRKK